MVVISPIVTNAKSFVNNNGIIISEEEYQNFLKMYSPEYIMVMNQEEYKKAQSIDYNNVETETKYIASTYNQHLNLTTEKEITEAEYNNYSESLISPNADSASHETQVKKITLGVMRSTPYSAVQFTATWKGIPANRSFDVIGLRGDGFGFRNGSQVGKQIYTLNGKYEMIDYAWNGTNIKRFDNGYGISMNIVNSNITTLQLTLGCDIIDEATYPAIYGSYQHAQKNLSLADSQNYTLEYGGIGNVFMFPYSIAQKYDNMSGIGIQY